MTDTRFTIPEAVEFKAEAVDGQGTVEGYASTFGNVDFVGDVIEPGAFKSAIALHKKNNTRPSMLWAHSSSDVIGSWHEMREDRNGLFVRGRITLAVRRGREAWALLKDKALSLSIGFTTSDGGSKTDGRGIRRIHKIARLGEVSLVPCPANPKAMVTALKRERPTTRKQYEHLLRNATTYSAREAKKLAGSGWAGLGRNDRETGLDEILNAIEELQEQIRSR